MASRKKPLSEQLAELLTPAPTAGHEDPEDAQGFGAEARAIFGGDESAEAGEGWGAAEAGVVRLGEAGAGRKRGERGSAVKEKGLSLRGNLVMEGREYGGNKSSRSALFDGWADDVEDDVADDDDDAEDDDVEDDVDERMQKGGDAGRDDDQEGEEWNEEEEGEDSPVEDEDNEDGTSEDDYSEDVEEEALQGSEEELEGDALLTAARATMDLGMDALDRDFEAALKDEFRPAATVAGRDVNDSDEDDVDEDGERVGQRGSGGDGGEGGGAPVAIARSAFKGAVRDEDKGRAVAAQRALWDRALELRIALQRPLQSACRLPHARAHAAYAAVAPDVAAEFQAVAAGTRTAIRQLLTLQDELFSRNAAIDGAFKAARAALAEGGGGDGEGSERQEQGGERGFGFNQGSIDDGSFEEVWEQISRAYERFRPFSQSSIDRWHRKTLLTSGAMAAGRSSSRLRALNQSVSQQVASALRAPDRLIQRSRLPREAVSVIGAKAEALAAAGGAGKKRKGPDGVGGGDEGVGTVGGEESGMRELNGVIQEEQGEQKEGEEKEPAEEGEENERKEEEEQEGEWDMDSYDDTEFYQQLLREFLDSSHLEELGIASQQVVRRLRGSKGKAVDRRASKGRKVRYAPMPALVNFMAPEPVHLPPVELGIASRRLRGSRGMAVGSKSKAVDRRASKGRKVRYAPMPALVNFMAPGPVQLPPVVESLFENLFGQVQGKEVVLLWECSRADGGS
ncbi:unnamed protein product [Closterium sp. NIES-64]|nr:unnamed protein product [Closterium sp. NIES-64]